MKIRKSPVKKSHCRFVFTVEMIRSVDFYYKHTYKIKMHPKQDQISRRDSPKMENATIQTIKTKKNLAKALNPSSRRRIGKFPKSKVAKQEKQLRPWVRSHINIVSTTRTDRFEAAILKLSSPLCEFSAPF